MSAETSSLNDMVKVLVEPLLENPEDLQVTSRELEEGHLLVEIRVHEDDVGKVIGRQGRIIKAIRTLVRAAASRQHLLVEVEILG